MGLFWGNIQLSEIVFPTSGLTSYYRFDETSGTVAYDALGAYNGTASNTTITASGKENNALSFNTTNSKVTLAGGSSTYNFERTNSFSISLWVKRTNIGGIAPFLWSKSLASGTYAGYSAYILSTHKLSFSLTNDGTSSNYINLQSATLFNSTTNWYNIVFTYDGSSTADGTKIYVNGVYDNSTVTFDNLSATMQTSAEFQIGNRNTTYAADAIIDEFGIWNRELSLSEVQAIYNAGAGRFLAEPLLEWNFAGASAANTGSIGDANNDYDLKLYTPTNTYTTDVSTYVNDGYAEFAGGTASCLSTNLVYKGIGWKSSSFSVNLWVQNTDLTYTNFGTPFQIGYYNGVSDTITDNIMVLRHQPTTSATAAWYAQFYNGSNDTINGASGSAYTTDVTMLTVTLTSTTMKFYINGSYVGEDTSLVNPITDTRFYNPYILIGASNSQPAYNSGAINYGFHGKIWKPQIYGKTLTQTEITALYNAGN